MNQHRAGLYLQIPAAYCRAFGGLRWAQRGEAVEFLDGPGAGRTFAFAGEVAQFLQGLLGPGRPCPAFGSVLHLMYLVGLGDRAGDPTNPRRIARVADVFRELGNPLRNAGALCARVHHDLSGVAEPPLLSDLLGLLGGGGWIPQIVLSHPSLGAMDYAEQPVLAADDFEARVRARIEEMPADAIRHWLKFGREPVPGVEDGASLIPPRGIGGPLDDLEKKHPRLSGLARLVEHLEGALALPPRRPDPTGLPAGGYWDLTNRGEPEHALPIQFALEPEEFLRRFAERELLYFHRETPARPVTRELILLLDQGIRTWGDVRLVLAGAAMAMARQGCRREIAVRLATTGGEGDPVDPEALDAEALANLLEGSDLSPDPAAALARLLMGGDGRRPIDPDATDIVLLTHPRSLAEPEVIDTARRVGGNGRPGAGETRLFAVTVDADGEVELSELRRARPVALHRCRVDLAPPSPGQAPVPPPPRTRRSLLWRGPVEPIPFPFQCGLFGPPLHSSERGARMVAFDEAGQRVLAVLRNGLLACYRVDGKGSEYLPRPLYGGGVGPPIHTVIGVQGGFVLVCGNPRDPMLAHYDFTDRVCTLHGLDLPATSKVPTSWYYYADLHTLVGRLADGPISHYGLDLGESGLGSSRTRRVHRAAERLRSGQTPWPAPSAQLQTHPGEPWLHVPLPSVRLNAGSGELRYDRGDGMPRVITPRIDGEPALRGRGAEVVGVHQGGDVLAVQADGCAGAGVWFLSIARAEVIGSLPAAGATPNPASFALSRDGQHYARWITEAWLEMRDVPGDRRSLRGVGREPGWLHEVALGRSSLLIHEIPMVGPGHPLRQTLVRWDRGRLEVQTEFASQTFEKLGGEVQDDDGVSDAALPTCYDSIRFVRRAEGSTLRVLIDNFNHLAVQDRRERLLVVFYVRGRDFAAWMPDGTRFGTGRLIGGGASRAAAERIAAVLRAAERDGGKQP